MLKYLSIALVSLCGCAHAETVFPNHAAQHQHALQVALDRTEHGYECRDRFLECGEESGMMTCSPDNECLIAGEEGLIHVRACLVKIDSLPYCKELLK